MPKEIKKTKLKKKINKDAKGKDIAVLDSDLDIEEDENAGEEELDEEVLKALNAAKKKKKNAFDDIDYVPELERGDLDLDLNNLPD